MDLMEFFKDYKLQDELQQNILDRRAVFKELGIYHGATHVIDVKPETKPVVMPSRRFSSAKQKNEEATVKKLVAARILEPCVSENAFRIVFVPKKNFGLRCTGDFRGIKAHTVPDRYPTEDPKKHIEWLASK
eukprot:Plantae.Rhodophyta-Palmaria_palmata.ctg8374.p2 GENE.Plantae.Rhodophyta-Palmaria_palmata.ctg8374~~Plantae.Rhodophyta-Palmaria_palmata.ctg8374.p2  ORF type:complete len:132 (-),score=25.97 Plantae.Rhodophyta-Palmaria_palmata.ctg8374:165-560(-)